MKYETAQNIDTIGSSGDPMEVDSDSENSFVKETKHCLIENTVQKLNLIDGQVTLEGAQSFAKALASNDSLLKLSFINSIEDEALCVFLTALHTNTTLQKLHLKRNSIGMVGASSLGNVLNVNKTIHELRLDKNCIDDAGLRTLAQNLSNSNLRVLSLKDNRFGDDGVQALATTLPTNTTLEHLNLSENYQIGNNGVIALARNLSDNSTLQELLLNNCNGIGDEGVEAIFQSISRGGTSLCNVGLRTVLGADAMNTIASVLRTDTSIQKLSLYPIELESLPSLAQALHHNITLEELHLKLDSDADTYETELQNSKFFLQKAGESKKMMLPGDDLIFYGWKALCRQRDTNGRFPMHRAALNGLSWNDGMKDIVETHYPPISEPDDQTGFYPFMLAAIGPSSDLTSVFELLRQNPGII